MKLYYLIYVQFGMVFRQILNFDGNKAGEFCHFINDEPNRIMLPLSTCETHDKVHIYILPLPSSNMCLLVATSSLRPLALTY